MRAYLVQHGEAHPEEVSAERELTPRRDRPLQANSVEKFEIPRTIDFRPT